MSRINLKKASSKRIKVAFIGAGDMSKEHIKAFSSLKNVEIVGIYSRTKYRAELLTNEFPRLKFYSSIKNLYLNTKADLVVIAVSIESTKNICFEALNYSWKLLVEKPVGINYEEALEIKEVVNSKNAELFVGLNRRYYASTIKLKEILEKYNGPRIVNIIDQEDINMISEMGFKKHIIENWMYANSIHLIDFLTIFCRGKLEDIEVIDKWNSQKPNFVMAKIKFTSGDIGIFQSFWETPSPWSVVVNTEGFRGELKPLEKLKMQYGSSRKQHEYEEDIEDINYKPGLRKQASNIVRYLQGYDASLVRLEEANKSMFLTSKIFQMK